MESFPDLTKVIVDQYPIQKVGQNVTEYFLGKYDDSSMFKLFLLGKNQFSYGVMDQKAIFHSSNIKNLTPASQSQQGFIASVDYTGTKSLLLYANSEDTTILVTKMPQEVDPKNQVSVKEKKDYSFIVWIILVLIIAVVMYFRNKQK